MKKFYFSRAACVLPALALMFLFCVSCRVQDVREFTVKVPGLKNPICDKVIQDAFMRQPGIVATRADFQKHELYVKYNSMVIAKKNIEYTIAGAGFDANDTKADTNAVAALPPECR